MRVGPGSDKRRPRLRAAAGAVALALLAGCTVGPNCHAPAPAALGVPDRFAADPPGTAPPSPAELAAWWQGLGDPVLAGLVDRALAAGPDVEIAGARLRQARAAVRQARASLLPSLSASGSVERSQLIGAGQTTLITTPGGGTTAFTTGGSATTFQLGLDASYEADLFGGNRRSVEAARASAESAEDALHDTQRSLVAEVALDYMDARSAQERLAIANANLKSQDETVQIVGWRVQAGLVSSLDLAQARAQRDQTAASIPLLETGFAQAANALAVLTAEPVAEVTATLTPARPLPLVDRALGAPVPAEVLARRPDVRAAERTLAAATAQIGVQTAALYPALNLSGSIGSSGTALANLPSNVIGTLLASISAPIFEGGAIRARIDQARGAADEAYGDYRRAVLTAVSDVENALVALTNARRREVALAAAVRDAQDALTFAQSQYQAGLIDFQQLLDAERTLLASQDGLALARADNATALVQLYKALGGGWQTAPTPADAAPSQPALVERTTVAVERP